MKEAVHVLEFHPVPETISDDPNALKLFIRNYPGPHLAVFTGIYKDNIPFFVHANYIDKKVSL